MSIYICYAYSDARLATKLSHDLIKRGFTVWMDQDLESNPEKRKMDWAEGIASSETFLVIFSPTATTSPELVEQLRFAAGRNRQIIVVERQPTAITRAFMPYLTDAPKFSLGRTDYDLGLVALIRHLGGDPDTIVRPELVLTTEAEEWLPGQWDVVFNNARNGVSGTGRFQFEADGKAVGLLNSTLNDGTPMEMRILGKWAFFRERFTISGESKVSVPVENSDLPERFTYVLSVQVSEITRDRFTASAPVGDVMTFTRVMLG